MKRFERVWIVLSCVLWVFQIKSQGRIQLGNIGKALITVDGFPAPAGTMVQLAIERGSFVGRQVSVIAGGYFSAGTTELGGVDGPSTLLLAGTTDGGQTWFYSNPFEVLLSSGPVLGAPDASIPSTFSGVNIVTIPEPSSFALHLVGVLTVLLLGRRCAGIPNAAKSFD